MRFMPQRILPGCHHHNPLQEGRGEFIRPNNRLRANEFAPTRAVQRFQVERYSQPTAVFKLNEPPRCSCKFKIQKTIKNKILDNSVNAFYWKQKGDICFHKQPFPITGMECQQFPFAGMILKNPY